jgi:type I restriction enzyme R subunit
MTATPLRDDNRDSYEYFGNPLYTYSLRQGIEDGFLAPYRVHRVSTRWDSVGFRPNRGQLDRDGRPLPDRVYTMADFERVLSLEGRNDAIAKHLTAHLRATDPYAKTIVFCVDQEHADQMQRHLNNERPDLVKEAAKGNSVYAARVTSEEVEIGRGFLDQFMHVDNRFPVILTTSQMLTTGVDAPTCRNVVLVRTVGTMNEFKQIIGRGTRVREDKGKLFFTILDYAGSATAKFADPEFDAEPLEITADQIDDDGNLIREPEPPRKGGGGGGGPREPKYHIHGGAVSVDTEVSYDLDAAGGKLRTMQVTQYTADAVRTLYANPDKLRSRWVRECGEVERELVDRGIDSGNLAAQVGLPDADLFDILCHRAYSAPAPTRRERAERLRKGQTDFFNQFAPEPRRILQEMLEQYATHGHRQLVMPDALEVGPIRAHGNLAEIVAKFGGADRLRDAMDRLQELLYSS